MPRSSNANPDRQATDFHRTTFRLPLALAQRLAAEAIASRETVSDIIAMAVEAELARRDGGRLR